MDICLLGLWRHLGLPKFIYWNLKESDLKDL